MSLETKVIVGVGGTSLRRHSASLGCGRTTGGATVVSVAATTAVVVEAGAAMGEEALDPGTVLVAPCVDEVVEMFASDGCVSEDWPDEQAAASNIRTDT